MINGHGSDGYMREAEKQPAGRFFRREIGVDRFQVGAFVKIDRFQNVEKIHDQQDVQTPAAKRALPVIKKNALPARGAVRSFLIDPAHDFAGIEKQKQLRRKKKKENRRHVQRQQ